MSEAGPASSGAGLRFSATALAVGAAVVAVGGMELDVVLLAIVAGAAFGDVARRAAGEVPVSAKDPTDLGSALGFLVVVLAAAFDLGRSAPGERGFSAATAAGLAIIGAGWLLRSRAVRCLGANFGVRLCVRDDQALVESGPYRRLRHPNYTGLLLVALGTALSLSSPSALAAIGCVWLPVLLVRIAREERLLLARFDGAYRSYMQRTWRLIVGIY